MAGERCSGGTAGNSVHMGVAQAGHVGGGSGGRLGMSAGGRGRAWVKASCAWSNRRALRRELWCRP
jgi:hypothetical protein